MRGNIVPFLFGKCVALVGDEGVVVLGSYLWLQHGRVVLVTGLLMERGVLIWEGGCCCIEIVVACSSERMAGSGGSRDGYVVFLT